MTVIVSKELSGKWCYIRALNIVVVNNEKYTKEAIEFAKEVM